MPLLIPAAGNMDQAFKFLSHDVVPAFVLEGNIQNKGILIDCKTEDKCEPFRSGMHVCGKVVTAMRKELTYHTK